MSPKTIRYIIYILWAVLLWSLFWSCSDTTPPQKPFIVIGKSAPDYLNEGYVRYEYSDKSGKSFYFYDAPFKHNVGDTLN